MDFKSFLSGATTKEFWLSKQKFCLQSSVYPVSFMSALFEHTEKLGVLPANLQKISLDSFDKKNYKSLLEQTILGSQTFYWFGDISSEGSDKATKELTAYLLTYAGPNIVGFFISDDAKDAKSGKTKDQPITLENSIDLALFETLCNFFGFSFDKKKLDLIKKVFQLNGFLALDTAYMLMNYMELVNAKFIDEFTPYILNLMGTQPSLSQLSESFFAKNSQSFFSIWSKIENDYPPVFWVIFWSEQIWKAYHVIKFLHEKNFINAKKMSYRLPYAFINRDWQKYTLPDLASAYDNLYSIDFAIKRGSNFYSLDLFYSNHFMKK